MREKGTDLINKETTGQMKAGLMKDTIEMKSTVIARHVVIEIETLMREEGADLINKVTTEKRKAGPMKDVIEMISMVIARIEDSGNSLLI